FKLVAEHPDLGLLARQEWSSLGESGASR
ncbi:hypothetical protein A2U01_0118861, partial [Trifolium medium]|nr:hypothetical protein [Trifolium medium]